MKRIFTLTMVTLMLIAFLGANSQDTVSSKYLPLKIGNSWTYMGYNWIIPPWYYEIVYYKKTITKDTVINGKRYFNGFENGWIRYDTLSGNLLISSTNGGCSIYPDEKIYDSLPSNINDEIICHYSFMLNRGCLSIDTVNVFGNFSAARKRFEHDGLGLGEVTYVMNIGIVETCFGEPPPCYPSSVLRGCVIDGIVYGDTTLTSVINVNTNIPEEFSLNQNYSNPFNPKTKIKFDIPSNVKGQTSDVKLTVCDTRGKEVAVLVNDKLTSGKYEIEFDGSNLPSGVYFYKLTAGEFSETKRMIFLK